MYKLFAIFVLNTKLLNKHITLGLSISNINEKRKIHQSFLSNEMEGNTFLQRL